MIDKVQTERLKKFIPESDMVKAVFQDLYPEEDCENWNEEILKLAKRATSGEVSALLSLLELTYLNAYNEGQLDDFVAKEAN